MYRKIETHVYVEPNNAQSKTHVLYRKLVSLPESGILPRNIFFFRNALKHTFKGCVNSVTHY